MNEELLELALKKIAELEKKVEIYFNALKVSNELDFVLKGGYILESDLDTVVFGEVEEEE